MGNDVHALSLAEACADGLWPVGGDPTFPESREKSDGWRNARDGFMAGWRAASRGFPSVFDDENRPASVYQHGWAIGFAAAQGGAQ